MPRAKKVATRLGKLLRKTRVDSDEKLVDMARRIGVSASYVSSIEIGRKRPSGALVDKIHAAYPTVDVVELTAAAVESWSCGRAILRPTTPAQVRLVMLLSDALAGLDDATCERAGAALREVFDG